MSVLTEVSLIFCGTYHIVPFIRGHGVCFLLLPGAKSLKAVEHSGYTLCFLGSDRPGSNFNSITSCVTFGLTSLSFSFLIYERRYTVSTVAKFQLSDSCKAISTVPGTE